MSIDKKQEEAFVEDVDHDGKQSPVLTGHDVAFQTGAPRIKSSEERQAELAAAQLVDPGIKLRSMVGLQFIWIVLTVCWCGGGELMKLWETPMSVLTSCDSLQTTALMVCGKL